MSKNSSQYWEKRIANNTWATYNSIEEKNRALLEFYDDAVADLKEELYSLAEKYSKNGTLTLSDMHKKNRLTNLQKNYENIIKSLGERTEEFAKDNMFQSFNERYKDVSNAIGVTDFSLPNKELMEELLQKPWRGDDFSSRLWKNQKKLAVSLNNQLLLGLQQGKTTTEIAIAVSNIMRSSFNAAHTLVRTETMHYLNQASMESYKDAGVKYVQIWAAEDERTCEECGQYHEKIYQIDKCPVLPFHPNCRCTVIPCFDKKLIKSRNKNRDSEDKKQLNTVDDAKSYDKLEKYLLKAYNINIDSSVKELDFNTCRSVLSGMESVFKDFPKLSTNISKLSTKNKGVMCCSGDTIYFNPQYFKDVSEFKQMCDRCSLNGWWVKSSTPASIGVHETGHAVESLLLDMDKSYQYDFERILAWNKGKMSSEIVSEALNNIKKTQYGKGKVNAELMTYISKYGATKKQETFAEAFADVYANGKKANPLSIEIKRIAIEKYNNLKGV